MSKKDLKVLGALATIGGAIVVIHGVTSKKWQTAHTVFTIIAVVVAVASLAS